MDVFGDNIIAEIQRDHIEQIQIHGVIGERDFRNLIYAAMLEIEFWYKEMMGKRIAAYWRNGAEQDGGNHHNHEKKDQSIDKIFLG